MIRVLMQYKIQLAGSQGDEEKKKANKKDGVRVCSAKKSISVITFTLL